MRGTALWMKKQGGKLLEAAALLENSNPADSFDLIKKIEKASRGEVGTASLDFFSRPSFIQSLINIGNKYVTDEKILEYTIRTLSTIAERCTVDVQINQKVPQPQEVKTQNVYDFLFSFMDSKNKTIKRIIAFTIPFFPQFDVYEKKWEYIMSIPKIAPYRDSINFFRLALEHRMNDIPEFFKPQITENFDKFIEKYKPHKCTECLMIKLISALGYERRHICEDCEK